MCVPVLCSPETQHQHPERAGRASGEYVAANQHDHDTFSQCLGQAHRLQAAHAHSELEAGSHGTEMPSAVSSRQVPSALSRRQVPSAVSRFPQL